VEQVILKIKNFAGSEKEDENFEIFHRRAMKWQ
jgi:hypothetical protein